MQLKKSRSLEMYAAQLFCAISLMWTGRANAQAARSSVADLPVVAAQTSSSHPAELAPGVQPLPMNVNRMGGHPAIPSKAATLIFVGTVISRQATPVEHGVTTTINASAESVLKQPDSETLHNVSFTRFGGVLEFPSGRQQVYRVNGENMPLENTKYLFFLNGTKAQGYKLMTAYRLTGTNAFPLDDPAKITLYQQYNGVPATTLLTDVRNSIR